MVRRHVIRMAMEPNKARQLSRLVLIGRIKAILLPGLIAFVVLAAMIALSLNVPLSVEQTSCRLVRWTQFSQKTVPNRTAIYCDLENGITIMAIASGSWMPPMPGTHIPLQIEHLVFGTRYRVNEHKILQQQ